METMDLLRKVLAVLPADELRDELLAAADLTMVGATEPASDRMFRAMVAKAPVDFFAGVAGKLTDPERITLAWRDKRVAVRTALARNRHVSRDQRLTMLRSALGDGRWEIAELLIAWHDDWRFAEVADVVLSAPPVSLAGRGPLLNALLAGAEFDQLAALGAKAASLQPTLVLHAGASDMDLLALVDAFGQKKNDDAVLLALGERDVDVAIAEWLIRSNPAGRRLGWGDAQRTVHDDAARLLLERGGQRAIQDLAECAVGDEIFTALCRYPDLLGSLCQTCSAERDEQRALQLIAAADWIGTLQQLLPWATEKMVRAMFDAFEVSAPDWPAAMASTLLSNGIRYSSDLVAGVVVRSRWAACRGYLSDPTVSDADKSATAVAVLSHSRLRPATDPLLRELQAAGCEAVSRDERWADTMLLGLPNLRVQHNCPAKLVVREMGKASSAQWMTLVQLWPTWEGTLGELISTVLSI